MQAQTGIKMIIISSTFREYFLEWEKLGPTMIILINIQLVFCGGSKEIIDKRV